MSTPRRPLDYLLLLLALGLLLSLIVLMTLPEGRVPMAAPHATLTPESGGAPLLQSRHSIASQPVAFGWAIGFCACIVALMCSLVWMGNQKAGRIGPLKWWLLGGFVIYAGFFGLMIKDYYAYSVEGDPTFWGGFPLSTGWMIYDIWLFPIFIALALIYFFPRWNWTPQDRIEFDQLLEQVKQLKTDGTPKR